MEKIGTSLLQTEVCDYFIGFGGMPPVAEGCLDFLLKEGFRHCFVFFQAGRSVVVVDPQPKHVEVSVVEDLPIGSFTSVWDIATRLACKNYRILHFTQDVDKRSEVAHISNVIPTCVSAIKATMGFRSWAITPYQLYCDLLKAGASRI